MRESGGAAPVSVVIITKDEEGTIERCLASVRWAPEIIVVDAHSSDHTAELAEQLGARVFRREWQGYSEKKNFGIAQASQPWILSIDADEQLTPALTREIQERLPDATEAAFAVRIPVYFLGKELGHYYRRSRWYVRLFRKDRGVLGVAEVGSEAILGGEADVVWVRNHYVGHARPRHVYQPAQIGGAC